MSPPSFETIGSQVQEYVNDNVFWNSPNMKFSVTSHDKTGLLVSILSHSLDYNIGPFYADNSYCSTFTSSKFFMSPFKDSELTFAYHQPSFFGAKFTFPLPATAVQQEFSAALSNSGYRCYRDVFFNDSALRLRSSYSSDNMVVDLVTECRGRKVKSYLGLVLSKDNLFVGPRFGVSLKKPSHWYFDLKLGYYSKNIEAFGFFSFKRFHSLQRFSYGVLRRHPRFDFGLVSFFDETSQKNPHLTVAACYKLNSWSFIKFCFTQDRLFAWNYGFTLLDGVTTTLGFSSDLKSHGNCAKFNASIGIAV